MLDIVLTRFATVQCLAKEEDNRLDGKLINEAGSRQQLFVSA